MFCRRLLSTIFFEYDTPKIVTIRSKTIGLLSFFIQTCILAYIIGYVMIYNKGYQEVGGIESAVTTKVKGVTVTNLSSNKFQIEENAYLYNRVWDVVEYVIPSSENEAFFVMTNVVITPNQTLGVCDENPEVSGADCTLDETICEAGKTFNYGNGEATGKCIESSYKNGTKVCEIKAWCPVERDLFPLKEPVALLAAAENYTVLIKNSISFPHFGESFKRNNILRASNSSYLQNCIYNNISDPFCPVFRLGDIVFMSGYNFSEMALKGGVMSIVIKWHCDLDWEFYQYCRPKYNFQRLDDPQAKISPGWNFRHAYHHEFGRRTLLKAYGIKFVIDVQGEARKFNLIPTMLNVGAGLALLRITTLCCDVVVLYIAKKRSYYKENKYQQVEGDDAFSLVRSEYQAIG